MDSMITAAARALATGDPLGALRRVALREDAPALALRGIAMAQLGDFAKAKLLVRRAARAFGHKEALMRARCIVAEAEIALASRELSWPVRALDAARATLDSYGDVSNAAHARYLEIRRSLLIGRIDDAHHELTLLNPALLPAALRTTHELLTAGIAMRRLQTKPAQAALARARNAARQAAIPSLAAEVESAVALLDMPAARLIKRGVEQPLLLADVEALFASQSIVVDACRHVVRNAVTSISLTTRPVLFSLAYVLGEAWPKDVSRDSLALRLFGLKRADESLRARLRVEIGRLRRVLRPVAEVNATKDGFILKVRRGRDVVVLARPVEEEHAAVLALLADGDSWSSSALALALGASQRTVQRALESLSATGKVQSFGHGRSRRWMTPPLPGFATTLLLPQILGSD